MRPFGQRFVAVLLSTVTLAALHAEAVETIDIVCPSSPEATLTISDLSASYQCSSTREPPVQMDVGYFMVNVDVKTLQVELQSSSVEKM